MKYDQSTGRESSKPADSVRQDRQLKAGWKKMESVNRATIPGSGNSEDKHMSRWKKNKASVSAVPEKGEISFVEIPYYPEGRHDKKDEAVMMDCPVAVIRTSKLRIEITNGISDSLLSHILSGVSHA